MVEEKDFPKEVTLKAVFRTQGTPREHIVSRLNEKKLSHELSEKSSGKGNFVSFTLVACYDSDDHLDEICTTIKSIEGFMLMV
jgi:putative lipoic acid-binding regulatory protein